MNSAYRGLDALLIGSYGEYSDGGLENLKGVGA